MTKKITINYDNRVPINEAEEKRAYEYILDLMKTELEEKGFHVKKEYNRICIGTRHWGLLTWTLLLEVTRKWLKRSYYMEIIEIHEDFIEEMLSRILGIYYERFPDVPLPKFIKAYNHNDLGKTGSVVERIRIQYENATISADKPLYAGGLQLENES